MEAEASLPHGGWLVSREEASEWALSLEEAAAAAAVEEEAEEEEVQGQHHRQRR